MIFNFFSNKKDIKEINKKLDTLPNREFINHLHNKTKNQISNITPDLPEIHKDDTLLDSDNLLISLEERELLTSKYTKSFLFLTSVLLLFNFLLPALVLYFNEDKIMNSILHYNFSFFTTLSKLETLLVSILLLIIGYFVNNLISYLIHNKAFQAVNDLCIGILDKMGGYNRRNLGIFYYLSPDYTHAMSYKHALDTFSVKQEKTICSNKCKKFLKDNTCECFTEIKKARRRTFIHLSNRYNLNITLILVTVVIILGYYLSFELILFLLIPRIFSRIAEICIAFYKDVVNIDIKIVVNNITNNNTKKFQGKFDIVNEWKTSSLRKGNRISLAIHSLIEIIFLFAIVHYSLQGIQTLTGYDRTLFFYEALFHSFAISTFNLSFNPLYTWWEKAVHILQLGVSINLIVLSLASYISLSDKLTKIEKEHLFRKHKNN